MQQKPEICHKKTAIAHALLAPRPQPGICRTSCKNPVIAKPVTDVTGCGNPLPPSLAPLPKGGWHVEAVTGGFLTSPHLLLRFRRGRRPRRPDPNFSRTYGRAHGPCPTRCCVIGGGRTESSAPTNRSVGQGALTLPPDLHRTSCKNPVIANQ